MTLFSDLLKRPGIVRYAKNLSWMFFARLFTMGVSFLTTLYIAQALGPTNFGELDYALAIIGMFGVLSSWGIDGVLNRELIKYPEKKDELVGTATLLRLILGALATTTVIIFAILSPIDQISKLLLVLLSFTFTLSTLTILQQVFLAQAESKYPSLITSLVTLVTNILKVCILISGKGVLYLALAMVLEAALNSTFYYLAYTKVMKRSLSRWSFSPESAHVLLKTGTAVAFLGAFAMIYSRVDQIMIKHMIDTASVGLYGASVRLVELWGFIPTIIGAALYPAILNARKVSEKLYNQRLRKLFLLYALPSFGIALFVSTLAKPLMLLIYGPQFIDGFHSLQIYIWSLPGTFIGFFVMNILFTDDYRKVLVFTSAIPAMMNIALNLAWIPTGGIMGAAWATVVSYSLIPFIPLMFKQTRTALLSVLRPRYE